MKEYRDFLRLIPGNLLLIVIGYGGYLAEKGLKAYAAANHLHLPNIEGVFWAILFGFIISVLMSIAGYFFPTITSMRERILSPGIKTFDIYLKVSIVLLGARFPLGDVAKVGGISLVLVPLLLVTSIGIMTWLGRKLGMNPKLRSLLATGSAICGVSAIIALKDAIQAKKEDVTLAIMVIILAGGVSMPVFPIIGHWLGLGNWAYGMWAGLGVDNTAEAVAAGYLYSDEAGRIAAGAKSARNATIGLVVLGYALWYSSQGLAVEIKNKWTFLWDSFPKFVLGFLVISSLATAGLFNPAQLTNIGNLSKWAFQPTFAGIGLTIDFHGIWAQRLAFVVAFVGEAATAAVALVCVLVAANIGGYV